MNNPLLDYFSGDNMAAGVWQSKYQMKDKEGKPLEKLPSDMHMRLAKEFARIEFGYKKTELDKINANTNWHETLDRLSNFGRELFVRRQEQTLEDVTTEFFNYFDKFEKIVPQGSIMSNLGNNFVFGSLSNCFVIPSPGDSYAGIMRADQELVQLMKRRGGVGTTLNNLRPSGSPVTNAAKTSSGVSSFAERYSNSTREVAQEGRRGALMLLLSCKHPEIFKFVKMKSDRGKVTGANISVMFTDEFMEAVEKDGPFACTFPVNANMVLPEEGFGNQGYTIKGCFNPYFDCNYNEPAWFINEDGNRVDMLLIKAKELWDEFTHQAWDNAEPGAAYIDRIQDYCPDGVYNRFKPMACNPCGEIWMSYYDACRLIAQNLFHCVDNPFSADAKLNVERLYEVSYMNQRLGDNLIDLEIEYIDKILNKLELESLDRQSNKLYDEALEMYTEINLWKRIRETTKAGRRTGTGITALGDMLAALGISYNEGAQMIEVVMQVKMEAELDATIDMSILRGSFEGWEADLEYDYNMTPRNSFFKMLVEEFPGQANRMKQYGRRNVSWSTIAPTGTVSLMTQTTSGIEPLFKAYYIRRQKINPSNKDARIDFTDQNGDTWQEFKTLHPKFKEWIKIAYSEFKEWIKMVYSDGHGKFEGMSAVLADGSLELHKFEPENITSEGLKILFEASPWYGSEANDISWEKRIELQSILQKYTSNAISSTINLPADVSKQTVSGIYMQAWKQGLKGVTIYREGSRTGVLIADTKINSSNFGYANAHKRPGKLEADYHYITQSGKKFAVVVGKMNNLPYELFAYEDPLHEQDTTGEITKVSKGVYKFKSHHYDIENLQLSADNGNERLQTRWVSQLLRHGVEPRFIADQVERSEVSISNFSKVIVRVLKKYIPNGATIAESCPVCNEKTMIYEEGCKRCTSCGNSKC